MIFPLTLIIVALWLQLASAHFELNYPKWRGDSFIPPASQYIFPCANINHTGSPDNRTMWPMTGGSLVIDFHHPFTYVWMNLGLGTNTSTFNISLNTMPLNETGNGTLCLPHVSTLTDLGNLDGTDATLQIITVGDSGTALYNCADITFSSNATMLTSGEGQCVNGTGVSIVTLADQGNGSTISSGGESSSSTAAGPSGTPTGGAGAVGDVWRSSLLAGFVAVAVVALGSV